MTNNPDHPDFTIHEFSAFASPRRVRIFLAEKGISNVNYQQVDVLAGEHRKHPFLAKNPFATVPVMELNDATCISETMAICRYIEEMHPENPLLGTTPLNKAKIEMWQRRIEHTLFNTIATFFHHATPGLGELEIYQNKEWGQVNKTRYDDALVQFDKYLNDKDYFAGDAFSVADITAICAIGLAEACGLTIPDELKNLNRWHQNVSTRPSFNA